MLKFIENLLSAFRSCFSRTRTYEWFLIIVSALLVRYDSLGVTSFIRALSLDHRFYETMLHFFRSSAYKTADLKTCWHKIIHRNAPLIRIGGRPLLLGDGCKVCKESRRMPGVKKLCHPRRRPSICFIDIRSNRAFRPLFRNLYGNYPDDCIESCIRRNDRTAPLPSDLLQGQGVRGNGH